ncbi:hypothetical protein QZH41_013930 [Actinostola sp. cb2023]|nr:hypothetical protein QZH41_013930 [Actinostola sp. cb2023]
MNEPERLVSSNQTTNGKDGKDMQKTEGVGNDPHGKQVYQGFAVQCSKYHMLVTISLERFEYLRPSSLRLEDASCVPYFVNETLVLFRVPLDRCGTYHNATSDKITYWNSVNGDSEENGNHLITRKFQVRLGFDCSYSKKRTLSVVSFSPRRKVVYSSADGRGNFTFMMNMYKTDQYKESYERYPVTVDLGQRLHLQIVVKSQSKLAIFADTCMVTPSSNPYDAPRYSFIRNGCSRDDTLLYDYKLSPYQQFSIEAFRFVNVTLNNVFIHCLVQVCIEADNDTVCARGCVERGKGSGSGSRRRREITAQDKELEYLTLGPIRVEVQGNIFNDDVM